MSNHLLKCSLSSNPPMTLCFKRWDLHFIGTHVALFALLFYYISEYIYIKSDREYSSC